MDPQERWQQVEDLFHAVMDHPQGERMAFLAKACSADSSLYNEVAALIAEHEQQNMLIDAPTVRAALLHPLLETTGSYPQTPQSAGRTIGPYTILALLGKGGMGEVYLAEDARLARKVALKILPVSLSSHHDRLRRFEREARAISALSHPNIITIFEVGESAGLHFLATEYVQGQTLRQMLSGGRLRVGQVIEIATQIASALAAAHDAGVVHRDIKPENIMVRPDGLIKVLDFGLAKLTEHPLEGAKSSVSLPGVIIGTPTYMSPEQACGRRTGAHTDLFSLGVVIYELLTGRPPFTGATPSQIIAAILTSEPPPLSDVAPETPPELQSIVHRALRKEETERYQTAGEILNDLKKFKRQLDAGGPQIKESTSGPDDCGANSAVTSTYSLTTEPTISARPFESVREVFSSSSKYLSRSIQKNRLLSTGLFLALLILAVIGGPRFMNRRPAIDSIAVLPLVNSSGDPNIEYLSDGLTEGIINNLSRLPGLKVICRNSVFRYKESQIEAEEIGHKLNVRALITGRIVRQDQKLIISLELVDSRDNRQIWGGRFERTPDNLFSVVSQINREISDYLQIGKGKANSRNVNNPAISNSEPSQTSLNSAAEDLYIRGRWHWNKRTGEGAKQAITYFQQAIDLDPKFALAYAGLADVYVLDGNVKARESYMRAKSAAIKALEFDNTLGESHATLGFISAHYEMDWANADREFRQAIELNPNYATAYHWYAESLLARGEFDRALVELKKAQELDPLSPMINTDVGLYYFYTRQYDLALHHFSTMTRMFPDFFPAHLHLGWTHAQKGLYAEAIEQYQRALSLSKRHHMVLAYLGHAYAVSGKEGEARAIIDELKALSSIKYVAPYWFVIVYTADGSREFFRDFEN